MPRAARSCERRVQEPSCHDLFLGDARDQSAAVKNFPKAKRPFPVNAPRLPTPPIPVIADWEVSGVIQGFGGAARRRASFSPEPPSLRIFPLFYRWHGGLAPCACQVRLSAAVPDGSVPIHALAAFGKRSAPLHTPWLPVATQPLSRATVCLCCMSFCISARSGSWLVCAKRLQ